MATPGLPLVTLFDPAAMRVTATLSQSSLHAIKLQTPAGPIVCHGSTFVAGSSSHPTFDQSTGYDIDSSCVSATDRRVRHLSQLAVIGVLWLEYGLFAFVVLGLILMLVRAVRGPQQRPLT